MKDVPREELISALLDGELTVDERRQAEQLLADDPACRQLYEELRLVRAAVSGLPRHQLDKDLSRRVLRRAEREMLLGSTPARTGGKRDEASVEPLSTAEATWRRDWRTVLWPALVVAAALLLMVFNSGVWSPPDDPQVAQQPAIAGKAPATGQHAGEVKAESQPSIAGTPNQPKAAAGAMQQAPQTSVRAAPNATAKADAASERPTERANSEPPPSAPSEPPRLREDRNILYLVAEVGPEVLRQSSFHEVLKAHEIVLAEEPPRRAPVSFGAPLASPSARAAIEEAARKRGAPTEAAYVVTAPREQVERIMAALGADPGTYTVVEQKSLSTVDGGANQESRTATTAARRSTSVARRFASRVEAEAAARQALRGASADSAVTAEWVTAVIVLRSPATDAKP